MQYEDQKIIFEAAEPKKHESPKNENDSLPKNEKFIKKEKNLDDLEDIYARKKRLLLQRDLLLKKKQEEREKKMKNFKKVYFNWKFY